MDANAYRAVDVGGARVSERSFVSFGSTAAHEALV